MASLSDKPTLHSLDKKVAVIESRTDTMAQDMTEIKNDIKTLLARRSRFPIKLTLSGLSLGAIWAYLRHL